MVLDSSTDIQFLKSLFQAFGDRFKRNNYNWYHRHPHVPKFFLYCT